MHWFSIENVIVGCLKRKKIIVFFLYDKYGGIHEAGQGGRVLKGLVMWAADGKIIFI